MAVTDTLLEWAARHSPDRIAAVGVLAVRVRRYLSEGVAPALEPIPGLRLRVAGHDERPFWHASTGLYGFLGIPPGEARIEIEDPAGRWQAQAISALVPDRSALRRALEEGSAPAAVPAPAYPAVALRPAPAMALAPGLSALWGVVRDGGRPVAGALLEIDTVRAGLADRVTGLSGADGSYLLVLAGEALDRSQTPPQRQFERALAVSAPRPALAARLARNGFLAALPANVFTLSAAERAAGFMPRNFQLRDAAGVAHPPVDGHNPHAIVGAGSRVRLDIELSP